MGKTIQIYMPDDEPRGVRIASLTTRIVQALVIPRRRLAQAVTRPEAANVAVYFLFGDAAGGARPRAYIGETEDVPGRLRNHNATKEFWNTAVVTVAEARFTKSHVKYLEWYCVRRAGEVGRYELENSNTPAEPFLPEPQIADCLDAFETIDTLLSTLGFPIFESARTTTAEASHVFYCRRSGADARGELTDDGFVVFEGSRAVTSERASANAGLINLRRQLLEDGVMSEVGDMYIFQRDYLFSSPSTAAAVTVGGSANGWVEWKDAKGRTLDDVYRQEASDVA